MIDVIDVALLRAIVCSNRFLSQSNAFSTYHEGVDCNADYAKANTEDNTVPIPRSDLVAPVDKYHTLYNQNPGIEIAMLHQNPKVFPRDFDEAHATIGIGRRCVGHSAPHDAAAGDVEEQHGTTKAAADRCHAEGGLLAGLPATCFLQEVAVVVVAVAVVLVLEN